MSASFLCFVGYVFQAAAGEVSAIPIEDRLNLLEAASAGIWYWATGEAGNMTLKALEKLGMYIKVEEG